MDWEKSQLFFSSKKFFEDETAQKNENEFSGSSRKLLVRKFLKVQIFNSECQYFSELKDNLKFLDSKQFQNVKQNNFHFVEVQFSFNFIPQKIPTKKLLKKFFVSTADKRIFTKNGNILEEMTPYLNIGVFVGDSFCGLLWTDLSHKNSANFHSLVPNPGKIDM